MNKHEFYKAPSTIIRTYLYRTYLYVKLFPDKNKKKSKQRTGPDVQTWSVTKQLLLLLKITVRKRGWKGAVYVENVSHWLTDCHNSQCVCVCAYRCWRLMWPVFTLTDCQNKRQGCCYLYFKTVYASLICPSNCPENWSLFSTTLQNKIHY